MQSGNNEAKMRMIVPILEGSDEELILNEVDTLLYWFNLA